MRRLAKSYLLNLGMLAIFISILSCGQDENDEPFLLRVTGASGNEPCVPVEQALVPGKEGSYIDVNVNDGRNTFFLECLTNDGASSTIYKLRRENEPEVLYKIAHRTPYGKISFQEERYLFVKFREEATGRAGKFSKYLVDSTPHRFQVKKHQVEGWGFIRPYVSGRTLAEMLKLSDRSAEKRELIPYLKEFYYHLKDAIEAGYNIRDISDENVIWNERLRKLYVIDGYYDPFPRPGFNYSQIFHQRCLYDWGWCRWLYENEPELSFFRCAITSWTTAGSGYACEDQKLSLRYIQAHSQEMGRVAGRRLYDKIGLDHSNTTLSLAFQRSKNHFLHEILQYSTWLLSETVVGDRIFQLSGQRPDLVSFAEAIAQDVKNQRFHVIKGNLVWNQDDSSEFLRVQESWLTSARFDRDRVRMQELLLPYVTGFIEGLKETFEDETLDIVALIESCDR